MVTWQDFEQEAPDLAPLVRARFTDVTFHVLATLRRGGAPRVSGTEVRFVGADLTLTSMADAVKVLDLQRDGRFALHSGQTDERLTEGDAKLAGVAVEITDEIELAGYVAELPAPPSGPFHAFRLDLTEAVLTTVEGGDHLLIRSWHPGEEVRSIARY